MSLTQSEKAAWLLTLHDHPRLLVLPNVWDPMGARMLESLGFPAVATASAAIASAHGREDGQRMSFHTMLAAVERVVVSVDLPVTADIEGGYAESPEDLAANMRRLLDTGAVGINLEDGRFTEGAGPLREVTEQAERIAAVREMADASGVPLVINARIDTYIRNVGSTPEAILEETVQRARAYLKAGADVIYPITASDRATLRSLREATKARINVYADKETPPIPELEEMGISRLSFGPRLLRAAANTMLRLAGELRETGSFAGFLSEAMSGPELNRLVTRTDRDVS